MTRFLIRNNANLVRVEQHTESAERKHHLRNLYLARGREGQEQGITKDARKLSGDDECVHCLNYGDFTGTYKGQKLAKCAIYCTSIIFQ